MPSPPAAVCRSSPVCAIRDRIYCVENQAVRADEAPSAWLGRGSGEDTGQALMSPHTAGKQPKPFLTEITALLAERSHKIFSPDQLQLLSKTAAKMSSELKADLESTDSAGQCWERGEGRVLEELAGVCVCPKFHLTHLGQRAFCILTY